MKEKETFFELNFTAFTYWNVWIGGCTRNLVWQKIKTRWFLITDIIFRIIFAVIILVKNGAIFWKLSQSLLSADLLILGTGYSLTEAPGKLCFLKRIEGCSLGRSKKNKHTLFPFKLFTWKNSLKKTDMMMRDISQYNQTHLFASGYWWGQTVSFKICISYLARQEVKEFFQDEKTLLLGITTS